MAQYFFETPPELVDESIKVMNPKELAGYLYHNYPNYLKDLQWEVETLELDHLYEGFDTHEEWAEHHGQQRFSFA